MSAGKGTLHEIMTKKKPLERGEVEDGRIGIRRDLSDRDLILLGERASFNQVRKAIRENAQDVEQTFGNILQLADRELEGVGSNAQLKMPVIQAANVGVCVIIGSSHDLCSIKGCGQA